MRVTIIGSGTSSALLIAQLAKKCQRDEGTSFEITVLEKEGDRPWWTGVAYGTSAPWHLLNVPAPGMSGLVDEPDHLMDWLKQKRENGEVDPMWGTEKMHIPRGTYGEYLAYVVQEAVSGSEGRCKVEKVRGEAVDVEINKESGKPRVKVASGETLPETDVVVVATGNFSPDNVQFPGCEDFYGLSEHNRYIKDPWRILSSLESVLPKESTVALLGTRQTAVDVMLSLKNTGYAGRLHLISRRGLLPYANHAEAFPPAPSEEVLAGKRLFDAFNIPVITGTDGLQEMPVPTLEDPAVDSFFKTLIETCNEVEKSGGIWQSIVDSIRPYFNSFWWAMSTRQRELYLAKYRGEFEIRRHRVAPGILEDIASMLDVANHHVGSITSMSHTPATDPNSSISIAMNLANGEQETFTVDYVVNCTGPQLDFRIKPPSRLFDNLIEQGLAVPEGAGIGLLINLQSHALIQSDEKSAGTEKPRIYAIGPPCKGSKWETIAIKDIRSQAQLIANELFKAAVASPA